MLLGRAEVAAARAQDAQLRVGRGDVELGPRRPPRPDGIAKERFGLVEVALVAQDLGHVELAEAHLLAIADRREELDRPFVEPS